MDLMRRTVFLLELRSLDMLDTFRYKLKTFFIHSVTADLAH